MNTFDVNDRVVLRYHPKKYKGTIKDVRLKASGVYEYDVYYDDSSLIPSHDWHIEAELDWSFNYQTRGWYSRNINTEKYCPNCDTEWHVIRFNMHVWKDCLKCGEKAEVIVKAHKQKIDDDF